VSYGGQFSAFRRSTQSPTVLYVELDARPRRITAITITAAINATMIAYSTAVAPRSLRMLIRATSHAEAARAVPKIDMLLTSSRV
jgi:hypothetical protein